MQPLTRAGFAIITILAFACGPFALVGVAPAGHHTTRNSRVTATLQNIYRRAYDEAYSRHATIEDDGTTFVSTGDIDMEWLRDSSATMTPYIGQADSDPYVRGMLRGTIARQGRYILIDPYANAFTEHYRVDERKFEMDSLLYPVWFAYQYWKVTGDHTIFTPQLQRAFSTVVATLRTEQRHTQRSRYRHPELGNNGRGTPTAYTGLVWTGFRPSDDVARYHFNIPDNMFGVVVLQDLTEIEKAVYRSKHMASNAWGLSVQIHRAIERYGVVMVPGIGRMYAYEIDGYGHTRLMDDANIPSLLSIPYFGYAGARDVVYEATRSFILSGRNPYYFQGKFASGIGSPHTPRGYVWPLALIMQILTSTDQGEVTRVLGYLAAADVGDHRLHESFNADWPEQYTRDDFAWPNALFAQMMITRGGGRR
ncbi:MAG: glycoside hydrolase family 125 protein [Candidatus Eremiobacteraeota bacterium]|nr:glycoside hydrolase family 125 protein [Candidatus Eremiobacteraeota bacterium]